MRARVAVMHMGPNVGLGSASRVLGDPQPPYTRLLLHSVPKAGGPLDEELALRRADLPGNRHLPEGCYFRDRCPLATLGCEKNQTLQHAEDDRDVRCWRNVV